MKVAILAGRPKDGTIFPKSEKFLWNELCRVMEEDLTNSFFKEATFLIPIYNKFDLYGLHIAEKNGNPVEYYVPSFEWGSKALPKHQTMLISRMNYERHIIPSNYGRLLKMIEDADVVYSLLDTEGFERFEKALEGKVVCRLDTSKMNFTTEDAGSEYYEQLKKNTQIYIDSKSLTRETDLSEKEALEILFGQAGMPLDLQDELF